MKKFLGMSSVAALLVLGSSVFAETKIAVIDVNKVMTSAPQFEAAKTSLKAKFDPKQKEVVEAQKKFQAEVQEFQKNAPTMKPEDKKNAEKKFVDQQKKLQEMQAKFQNEVTTAQNDAMNALVKKLEDTVAKIAKEKQFDLVIAKQGAAYSKPELDITEEVVKQIKK